MKRLIALAILFSASLTASAHVLLTSPYAISGEPGIAAVTAPHVTMTGMGWTWGTTGGGHNIMMITYSFGTAVFSGGIDTGFTIAPGSPTIVNQLHRIQPNTRTPPHPESGVPKLP